MSIAIKTVVNPRTHVDEVIIKSCEQRLCMDVHKACGHLFAVSQWCM